MGIGIYYHVNKEYIAQKLCENRNNPAIHCNGHCYLSKQLNKAEQNEKQSAQFIKEKEEIISNQNNQLRVKYFPSYTSLDFLSYTPSMYLADNTASLLKPPAA